MFVLFSFIVVGDGEGRGKHQQHIVACSCMRAKCCFEKREENANHCLGVVCDGSTKEKQHARDKKTKNGKEREYEYCIIYKAI